MIVTLFALYDWQEDNVIHVAGTADSISVLFHVLTSHPAQTLIKVVVTPPCYTKSGIRIEKWERPAY